MNKIIITTTTILLIYFNSFSQFKTDSEDNKFVVFGKCSAIQKNAIIKKKSVDIEIFENDTPIKKYKEVYKFKDSLTYNHEYLFVFTRNGFVQKKIAILTTGVPAEAWSQKFEDFEFHIQLYPQKFPPEKFAGPVGIIKYNEAVDDFNYETDYKKTGEK